MKTLKEKMVLSFTKDLYIKNIIILKHPKIVHDLKIISFSKRLSKLNIYTSFLPTKEIELKMNDHGNSNEIFLKSLIVTFEEKFNNNIYKIITENEKSSYKFLWLTWKSKNIKMIKNTIYVPYNCQLFIAEDDVIKNDKIFMISEKYHAQKFRSFMFERRIGVWSEYKGLDITEKDLYKRRLDMNGTELRILNNKVE